MCGCAYAFPTPKGIFANLLKMGWTTVVKSAKTKQMMMCRSFC